MIVIGINVRLPTEMNFQTRAGCSYLKQLCTDEFELFKEFFSTGEDHLYQYLETLCDYLYDDLRPRILHEPRLTALCEVCTVLQALMVLDVDADTVGGSPPSSPTNGSRLHISQLLQMILQDAQTRLFFKAQAVVQSDIRHYVPSKEDLVYPGKLLTSKRLGSIADNEKASVSQLWRANGNGGGDDRDTWYPTLKKTVWVLEQLHEFVNVRPYSFYDLMSNIEGSLVSRPYSKTLPKKLSFYATVPCRPPRILC